MCLGCHEDEILVELEGGRGPDAAPGTDAVSHRSGENLLPSLAPTDSYSQVLQRRRVEWGGEGSFRRI